MSKCLNFKKMTREILPHTHCFCQIESNEHTKDDELELF